MPMQETEKALAPQGLIEEARVQLNLAQKEGRDRWHEIVTEIDRRRQKVQGAVDALSDGGTEASRKMAMAAKESLAELRAAVDEALAALR